MTLPYEVPVSVEDAVEKCIETAFGMRASRFDDEDTLRDLAVAMHDARVVLATLDATNAYKLMRLSACGAYFGA